MNVKLTDEQTTAFSTLIDEIFGQRVIAAVEAQTILLTLTPKTYPASRRSIAENQVLRLRQIACGEIELAYAGTSYLSLDGALRESGGEPVPYDAVAPYDVRLAGREVTEGRRALAYELGVSRANMSSPRFPKRSAALIEGAHRERLIAAATGNAEAAAATVDNRVRLEALRDAGAPETLTNHQWLEQRHKHDRRI